MLESGLSNPSELGFILSVKESNSRKKERKRERERERERERSGCYEEKFFLKTPI